MKRILLLTAFLLTGAVAVHAQTNMDEDSSFEAAIADIHPVPECIRHPATRQGRIEEMRYSVKRNGQTITKRAQVYVPAGYDDQNQKTRYNVVYLMHGGGDNTTSFLTPPHGWLPLAQVADHLIEQNRMKPVLIVCPTFYDDDQNIGANGMDNAIKQTREFHKELQEFLIPAVAARYRTFLKGRTDSTAIAKTRSHRAFGGFSMGALCTWFQLAYGISAVRNYLPLSGDIWTYDKAGKKQDAAASAKWMADMVNASGYANDFQVYGYSGTKDIAGTPEKNAINALSKHYPTFRFYGDNTNIRFSMKEGGEHYYGDINQYLYYALPLLWPVNQK